VWYQSGTWHVDTFYLQDGACPNIVNVVSPVLLIQFLECFWCGWPWPPEPLDLSPCDYFLWGYFKDNVCCTNPHTVKELQTWIKAITEEITDDLLHDTADKFVIHLQRIHEVIGSHIKHMFTRKPHAHKLSMKVSFRSYIVCFCTLENYEYTVHWHCCMFFQTLCRML
jgi:hypothetical protein